MSLEQSQKSRAPAPKVTLRRLAAVVQPGRVPTCWQQGVAVRDSSQSVDGGPQSSYVLGIVRRVKSGRAVATLTDTVTGLVTVVRARQ